MSTTTLKLGELRSASNIRSFWSSHEFRNVFSSSLTLRLRYSHSEPQDVFLEFFFSEDVLEFIFASLPSALGATRGEAFCCGDLDVSEKLMFTAELFWKETIGDTDEQYHCGLTPQTQDGRWPQQGFHRAAETIELQKPLEV